MGQVEAHDIPQDVVDAAMRACNAQKGDLNNDLSMVCVYVAARAIMDERERCRTIAHRESNKHGERAAAACLEVAIAILEGGAS